MKQQKNIWIIGASSGIGAALCQELASQGHTIAASARRTERLHEVIASCHSKAPHLAIALDAQQICKLLKRLKRLF